MKIFIITYLTFYLIQDVFSTQEEICVGEIEKDFSRKDIENPIADKGTPLCEMDVLKYSKDFPSLLSTIRNNPYPVYPQFTTFMSRLKTFDSFPSTAYQNKYSLAEGGFIYTGHNDATQCFFCGLVLKNWTKDDDVWTEHSRWNPKCSFVLLYKGYKFVEDNKCKKNNCTCEFKSYDTTC